jgi:hypothetical protein
MVAVEQPIFPKKSPFICEATSIYLTFQILFLFSVLGKIYVLEKHRHFWRKFNDFFGGIGRKILKASGNSDCLAFIGAKEPKNTKGAERKEW